MYLKGLKLINFRNFPDYQVEFSKNTTLIIGQNGSGKSSLLEAIYLLSSGESLRANQEAEMIRFEQPFAKVTADCQDGKEVLILDLTLEEPPGAGLKKVAKLNGVKKTLSQFWGLFKTVEFGPEDINLVTGSPDLRRRYLNSVLNQVSQEYRQSYLGFEKARRQKNILLDQIREGQAQKSELEIWNEPLLENGLAISHKREEFLEYLNKNLLGVSFKYYPSLLSPQRLKEFEDREIAAGSSLIGPQRDDFCFEVGNSKLGVRNLASFGSRGEQRLAVFGLKLGELNYFRQQLRVEPILLLDDIFSELDDSHRQEVWQKLDGRQVVLTANEAESVNVPFGEKIPMVRL